MVILDVNPFDVQCDGESEIVDERDDDFAAPVDSLGESASLYRCEKCVYESHNRELFERHVIRHSMDRPFECTLCDYSVSDHSVFVDHLVSHQRSRVVQCPFCPHAASASSMESHMVKHRPADIFDCSDCEFTTNNRKSLDRHIGVCHNPIFKCEYCEPPDLIRRTQQDLIEHLDEVHGIGETAEASTQQSKPILLNRDSSVFCPELVVKSEGGQDLDDGIANSQDGECTDDNIERTYDCPACEFSSPLKVLLKYHILSMHTMKIPCRYCSAVMSKHALIQHTTNVHGITKKKARRQPDMYGKQPLFSDLQEFKPQCGESEVLVKMEDDICEADPPLDDTRGESNYSVGTRKPFACSLCDFSSHNEWSLTCHNKFMHTVKYNCNHCPAVMSKYDIIKHTAREHGVEIRPRGPSGLREATDAVQKSLGQEDATDRKTLSQFRGHFKDDTHDQESNMDCSSVQKEPTPIQNRLTGRRCSFCGYSNVSLTRIQIHTQRMHVVKYQCEHCLVVMPKYDLIQHYDNVHGVAISNRAYPFRKMKVAEGGDLEDDAVKTEQEQGTSYASMLPTVQIDSRMGCSFCMFKSSIPSAIKIHEERMHKVKYRCDHCPAVMVKYDLFQHNKEEHGVELRKSHRFRRAAIPSRRGSEFHTGTAQTDQNCPEFEILERSVETPTVGGSRQTIEAAKPNGEAVDENLPNPPAGSGFQIDATTETFRCDLCAFSSSHRKSILMHVANMHKRKYSCNDCAAVLTKHELIVHAKGSHGVVIPPNGRGYGFNRVPESEDAGTDKNSVGSTTETLGRKSESISASADAADRYNCSKCEFTTLYPYNLKCHFDNLHEKLFQCRLCSAVKTKFELYEHTENEHNIVSRGNNVRFWEYFAEAGEEDGTEAATTAPDVECGLISVENGQPVDSVKSRPRSTPKPDDSVGRGRRFDEVDAEQTGNPVESIEHDPYEIERNGDDFICSFCRWSSKYKKRVKSHVASMHLKQYGCNECPVELSKYDLIRHYKSEHSILIQNLGRGHGSEFFRDLNSIADGRSDGTEVMKKVADKFQCAACDYFSNMKYHLPAHFETFHKKKFSCVRCSVILTKYEMIRHYETEHDVVINKAGRGQLGGLFKEVGPADGTSESALAEEDADTDDGSTTSIREGEEFKCSSCAFSTSFRFNLKTHFECFHRKKYSCTRCSLVMTKYEMVCHYENVHRFVIPNFGRGKMDPYFKAVNDFSEDVDSSVIDETVIDDPTAETDGHAATEMDPDPTTNGIDDGSVLDEPSTEIPRTNGSLRPDKRNAIIKENGLYKCTICAYFSLRKLHAELHFSNHHKKMYSCNRCSAIMTRHGMVKHYDTDHGVSFPTQRTGGPVTKFCKFLYELAHDADSPDLAQLGSESVAGNGHATTEIEIENDGDSLQEGKPFRCLRCRFSAQTRVQVQKHVVALHTNKFSCNRCSVVLTKHDMLRHYETEHGIGIPFNGRGSASLHYFTPVEASESSQNASAEKDFVCGTCEFSTKYEYSMTSHMENLHKRKYSCDHCHAVFTKHDLIEHCKNVHGVVINAFNRKLREVRESSDNDDPPGDSESSYRSPGGVTLFHCSLCDYSGKLRMHLRAHTKNMHTIKHSCGLCSLVMTKHELLDHQRDVHGASSSSANADLPSSSESDEISDAEAMQARSVFSCAECSFTTKSKWYLKDHTVKFHKTKYSCTHCSSVLTKYDLIKHCKNFHGVVYSSRQPFQEAKDGRRSVAEGSLQTKNYQGTPSTSNHTNADGLVPNARQPEQEGSLARCSKCDYSTPHKWYLKEHIVNIHEKKHSCSQCSAVMTKHELREHSVVKHGAVLKRMGKLPSREIVKTKYETADYKKPKSFPCVSCSFSSFHQFGLQRHVKIQHTIKHACQRCPAVMTRHELINHYRKVHNTDVPGNDPTTLQPSGDDASSVSAQEPTQSQVVNPKFRSPQQNAQEVLESPAFQPVVTLERLPIENDDDQSFSIVDTTESPHDVNADSPVIENPKFHDPSC